MSIKVIASYSGTIAIGASPLLWLATIIAGKFQGRKFLRLSLNDRSHDLANFKDILDYHCIAICDWILENRP